MFIMTKELFVNGELAMNRKETHGKSKQIKSLPVFTSRVEKCNYYKGIHYFDIRNGIDVKEFLKEIRANWNTYVLQVHQWIQRNPIKKIVVTGIFTVVLGFSVSSATAACIQEYTYQVKNGEKIEDIAAKHGVTAKEILDANGLSSIDGKKILLPKIEDRSVTATILNVRSQPNTKSSIIGKYKMGDVVKVSFIEDGWAGIFIKGQVCFVSANYLTSKKVNTPTTNQISKTTKRSYVTATSLRVREEASMNSSVVGSLKLNDVVYVLSSSNGWAKINFNGKVAFISEEYVTNIEPVKTENEIVKKISSKSMFDYVIKRGDTFTKLGKTYGISVKSIQESNPTADSSKLKIGQKIKIPTIALSTSNQINVTAQIAEVDPKGTFRFTTSDGSSYFAKASGDMLKELVELRGEKMTLTLEGKRGQQLKLITLH
jgi:uncharacterized protein YgiM (DUF1202 family)